MHPWRDADLKKINKKILNIQDFIYADKISGVFLDAFQTRILKKNGKNIQNVKLSKLLYFQEKNKFMLQISRRNVAC